MFRPDSQSHTHSGPTYNTIRDIKKKLAYCNPDLVQDLSPSFGDHTTLGKNHHHCNHVLWHPLTTSVPATACVPRHVFESSSQKSYIHYSSAVGCIHPSDIFPILHKTERKKNTTFLKPLHGNCERFHTVKQYQFNFMLLGPEDLSSRVGRSE